MMMMMMMLTPEQIDEFRSTGSLVVENVFSAEEVQRFRDRFHLQLLCIGMDHDRIISGQDNVNSGPRLKSKVSEIFYAKWKMDVHLDERVYTCARQLLVDTFGRKVPGFEHPFERFDDILAYIDRVCYRLPDHIRAEGGLQLHLDRNPTDPYLTKSTGLKKWRPIQAIITLTDHFGSECGGLKVVKGFHLQSDAYFQGQQFEGGGEFTRLTSKSHVALSSRLETIQAPAGSLIFWDNRLPHATCEALTGNDTREVVYAGFLPDIELNRLYGREQLNHLRSNLHPPAYFKDVKQSGDRDWREEQLSPVQRKLLLLNEEKKGKEKAVTTRM